MNQSNSTRSNNQDSLIRINMVVEGQTEETFVRDVLAPHLRTFGLKVRVRMVETGRRGRKIFRGGLVSYEKLKLDLENWMERDTDAWFTTMIDLYGLPKGFPGLNTLTNTQTENEQYVDILNSSDKSDNNTDPYEIVRYIEDAVAKDMNHPQFIPYIQLHEFEALILTEPLKFSSYFFKKETAIDKLNRMAKTFKTPEHINNGFETAPSKRIINLIPEYRYNKKTAGPIIADEIGLAAIRNACIHFNQWLTQLESIK
ncbi:DUF4276 family protein [Desulfuribacillus alkaliarsenatis]|uniref:DUF4276 family protein n=1 Tax=Desulfuribacillus alkaliarsenatis TaxID=766136 RepID=A0A1E5G3T0_9FIRM|nr:DUF4276 family protein [Desulfuribacillus alkaliarsenatis]OEF97733.1 hypothetical protein BHF68_14145 [Desulfuribacillus alkaliarsenatis]